MATAVKSYEEDLKVAGPKNDDQLHQWIIDNIGVNIPRAAVCLDSDPPHSAPFTFLADLYFERVGSALAMANRGGAKTFLVALLHYLNSTFKPGCEGCTFGATEPQSLRAYSHLKSWITDKDGNRKSFIEDTKMKETLWKNGSRVEVLAGTKEAVNGPHPQKAHADEVELMRQDTWEESRNMAIAKVDANGNLIKPQDILTSTRKGPRGRMQELIDKVNKANAKGMAAPYDLYAWCIFEVTAQVQNCREAPENKDKPEEELCQCHRYQNGFWDDGKDRYLNQVCRGKFYRARGWKPYEDITNTFMQNSRAVWEAQQECSKASTENLILPQFSDKRNIVKHFLPNPKNGPIYMAVDWGGTAANAVGWYQLITWPVTALGHDDEPFIIPENSLVCFDEIYVPDIPPTKLGLIVHDMEDEYRRKFGDEFRVDYRFPDPHGSGRMARNEWARMERPLRTHFVSTHNFEIQVTYLHELIDDGRFFVDQNKCPMFIEEALSWKRDPKTNNEVKEFNHAMSQFRYAVSNIRVVNDRILRKRTTSNLPVDATDHQLRESPVPISVKQKDPEMESWRQRFTSAQPLMPGRQYANRN